MRSEVSFTTERGPATTIVFLIAAINESCLVFDGKLVVDADFHTNDPRVRAAGPLTKYQRRYHAESW